MRRLISLVAAFSALVLATNVVLARAQSEIRTLGDERVAPNAMVQATLRFTPGMIKSASGDEVTWTHDDQTTARIRPRSSRRSLSRLSTPSSGVALPAGRARRLSQRTTCSARRPPGAHADALALRRWDSERASPELSR